MVGASWAAPVITRMSLTRLSTSARPPPVSTGTSQNCAPVAAMPGACGCPSPSSLFLHLAEIPQIRAAWEQCCFPFLSCVSNASAAAFHRSSATSPKGDHPRDASHSTRPIPTVCHAREPRASIDRGGALSCARKIGNRGRRRGQVLRGISSGRPYRCPSGLAHRLALAQEAAPRQAPVM